MTLVNQTPEDSMEGAGQLTAVGSDVEENVRHFDELRNWSVAGVGKEEEEGPELLIS